MDMPEPRIKEKRWSKDFEPDLYSEWKDRKAYGLDPKTKKEIYSIDTPPPYVNTPVHIGQATTYVLMDFFARFRRMMGNEVLFPLGLDRNGLPIEMAAEKKFNVKLTGLPRAKALEYCESILEESSLASMESFLRSGISFNSWEQGDAPGDVYFTDSPSYRALTQSTFIDLWNKGLIYEDERVTNYCPGCQTTIADAEVSYEDRPGRFHDIIFRVKETGEKLVIGTTRPELVCTCGMIIFNPDDKRYSHLEGKTAVSPVFSEDIPIRSHPAAEIEKGTGIMMMCSFGDLTDIRFFREMSLEPRIAINKDGTMNEHAGFLQGLPIKAARERMVRELEKQGLLAKLHPVMNHRTPVCERSKDPVEFISMNEFYLKQVEFKPKMKQLAKKLRFFAPKSRQILLDWIDSVSIDWPISRRRYYATEIPIWHCSCGEVIVPPKGRYYKPWKESPPKEALKSGSCPKCGGKDFKGETRVFDTWFDSSISPLYILMWGRDDGFFSKHKPATLRPQGKEIVRTWLYYTVLKDYLLTGDLIFMDVWVNHHIVDDKGIKMSKSKGNMIDPKDVLDRFGAEPFRLWAATEGSLDKTDFRCSFDRIDGAGKTLTKLWNVARFISMFPYPKRPRKIEATDQWILSEASRLTELARKGYGDYDFHGPVTQIKHFVWETFASHYLELVKTRAYNQDRAFSQGEQDSARFTLHCVLDTVLRLLAPVVPFITQKLYTELRGREIHSEAFPVPEAIESPIKTEEIEAMNSYVWKAKKDAGLSLRDSVSELIIPKSLKPAEKDIMGTHKPEAIRYGRLSMRK